MNEIWHNEKNLASFCKILEKFSYKKSKSIAYLLDDIKFPTKAICYHKKNLPHKLFILCWILSRLVDPYWEIYHAPNIKIAYTPHICAAFGLKVRKNIFFVHPKMLCSYTERRQEIYLLGFIKINAPNSWRYFFQKFVTKRGMGYAEVKKRTKRSEVKKKRDNNKDSPCSRKNIPHERNMFQKSIVEMG